MQRKKKSNKVGCKGFSLPGREKRLSLHPRSRTVWMELCASVTIATMAGRACRTRTERLTFRVHSLAVDSYLARSVLYRLAISGTRGSSGFGSVRSEQIESNTVGDGLDVKLQGECGSERERT